MHYGDDNFNLAGTYNNIGEVYTEQGKLGQALDMFTKCLDLEKVHYGDNDFNLANTYEKIGGIFNDQGELE